MYKTKNKRNKKHKKTRKYYGGSPHPDTVNTNSGATVNTNSGAAFKSNEGVFNILGNKLSGFASSTLNYIEEKALRAAGLKKIQDDNNAIIFDLGQIELELRLSEERIESLKEHREKTINRFS